MSFNPADYPSYRDVPLAGKRVLMRVDYNIPPAPDGTLPDDFRLLATVPGLREIAQSGAKVVLLTHRGRPGGRPQPHLSTQPLALRLRELLGLPVRWAPDCIGRTAEQAAERLAPGEILLLENTRFHLGDTLNQFSFTQELMRLGEVFINDAFATSHRPHASVAGLAAAMPVSVLGPLMIKELTWLQQVLENPVRPLTLILGGAQVGDKLALLRHLMPKMDTLMVAGVLGNTILAARDMGLGRSSVEAAYLEEARDVLTEAGVLGCRLHLPQDVMVRPLTDKQGKHVHAISVHHVAPDDVVGDLGPQTLALWKKVMHASGTLVWIGSVGLFEEKPFQPGMVAMAKALVESPGFTLVAGDGLLKSLGQLGLRDDLPRASTAGGALLQALSGQHLPALQVLAARKKGAAA